MEDFTSVIWIVIIVGAMIFNVISQSRKARGKSEQAPQHDEAWPTSTPLPMFPQTRPVSRPVPQPFTTEFPDEGQSLEEIPAQEFSMGISELEATDSGSMHHQTSDRLSASSTTHQISTEPLTLAAQDTAATGIAADFDLRQAIIYSEILKPKFEDHL